MKTLLIYLSFILLAIAVWNAYVILWKTENEEKYSKIWHKIGLAIRVMIYFIPFFSLANLSEATKWSLLFVSVGGVLYDFVINLIRFLKTGKPDLWYVDNKGWNAVFLRFFSPKWYWIARGGFVLLTIIIFLL